MKNLRFLFGAMLVLLMSFSTASATPLLAAGGEHFFVSGGDTIICSACNGLGNTVCEACKGERQVPREFDCGTCHGSGGVDCNGCEAGYNICPNEGCNNGQVTGGCPDCWGKSPEEVAQCRRCGGTGQVTVTCMYCKGSGQVCHTYCNCQGELLCPECGGRKTVEKYTMCLVCSGNGYHDCYTCDGAGYIVR